MKISIIGNGYVGKATEFLFTKITSDEQRAELLALDVVVYDKDPSKTKCSFKEVLNSDLFFVCVPTPMKGNGSCDLSFVEEVLYKLTSSGVASHKIVLRSTVPVGTCDRFGVNFFPEFLTEANWRKDIEETKDWIIGMSSLSYDLRSKMPTLLKGAIHFCLNSEAELVKYTRNCFLATKVSFFNEINNFCESKNINYKNVIDLITLDSRINPSHTSIPGPDGKKGFGGTCFPKDMHSLKFQMQLAELHPFIIKAALERNESIDRPEKDWLKDKGRAVV